MSPVQLQPDMRFWRFFGISMLSTSRIGLNFHDACRSECAVGRRHTATEMGAWGRLLGATQIRQTALRRNEPAPKKMALVKGHFLVTSRPNGGDA
jgi:hypothetical protein